MMVQHQWQQPCDILSGTDNEGVTTVNPVTGDGSAPVPHVLSDDVMMQSCDTLPRPAKKGVTTVNPVTDDDSGPVLGVLGSDVMTQSCDTGSDTEAVTTTKHVTGEGSSPVTER